MLFVFSLAVALAASPPASSSAAPRLGGVPLVVQQLRTCQEARLAIGIPLEAPPGTLSEIARIDVLSSLRLARTLGLIYTLRNGREFFALASGLGADRARLEATSEFVRGATAEGRLGDVDLSNEGYAVDPIVIDDRRLSPLGLARTNCAAVRVL